MTETGRLRGARYREVSVIYCALIPTYRQSRTKMGFSCSQNRGGRDFRSGSAGNREESSDWGDEDSRLRSERLDNGMRRELRAISSGTPRDGRREDGLGGTDETLCIMNVARSAEAEIFARPSVLKPRKREPLNGSLEFMLKLFSFCFLPEKEPHSRHSLRFVRAAWESVSREKKGRTDTRNREGKAMPNKGAGVFPNMGPTWTDC